MTLAVPGDIRISTSFEAPECVGLLYFTYRKRARRRAASQDKMDTPDQGIYLYYDCKRYMYVHIKQYVNRPTHLMGHKDL